jgi:hypothetical protein
LKYPARNEARSLVLLRGRVATVCEAGFACGGEAVAAFPADGITSSFVFVVGGGVADAGVQPDGVAFGADAVQLGVELTGVAGFTTSLANRRYGAGSWRPGWLSAARGSA